jgi:hypothetical protein
MDRHFGKRRWTTEWENEVRRRANNGKRRAGFREDVIIRYVKLEDLE